MEIVELTFDPDVAADVLVQLDRYVTGNVVDARLLVALSPDAPKLMEPGRVKCPDGCRVLVSRFHAEQMFSSVKVFKIETPPAATG